VAFRLFREHGVAATTMDDIAKAVGLSRPTLFRYFPSKSQIVWEHYEVTAARFRELLSSSVAGTSVVHQVFATYRQMVVEDDRRLEVIKSRIALVVSQADALSGVWDSYEEWGNIVSEYVARRTGVPADSLDARIPGRAIWSALWTAITAWAVSDDDRPERYLDEALAIVIAGPR
jgi:AcrR family transcriptional regulator